MSNKLIYFDHASTCPLSSKVQESIIESYKRFWGNPSTTYNFGIKCATELERLRNKIAIKFDANYEDIIFTSGSSESISIVFSNISNNFTPGNITISSVEHQATIIASNILKKRGWEINYWPVNIEGIIDIEQHEKYINSGTKLVSLIWGQSEIGSIQPVQEVGKVCLNKNIFFHIDATQIISNGIFSWSKLNCDLLSFSAHKFGGPKGIGVLLAKKRARNFLQNKDISLTQENSIRQGTQSIPLVSGLYKALDNIKAKILFKNNQINFINNKTSILRDYLLRKIMLKDNFQLTGSYDKRLPNHMSFLVFNNKSIPIEAYKIVNYMSSNNVAISSGSACSSSSNEPSRILKNIGLSNNKLFSNIRLSFGDENNTKEIDRFYSLILECINNF